MGVCLHLLASILVYAMVACNKVYDLILIVSLIHLGRPGEETKKNDVKHIMEMCEVKQLVQKNRGRSELR